MTTDQELPVGKESIRIECKSLRILDGKSGFGDLAKECVAFANAQGGTLFIGVEDREEYPPVGQIIEASQVESVGKRIRELTANVNIVAEKRIAGNGGEYIRICVDRSNSVASTTDGKFYIRIMDESKPVVGEEALRLVSDRSGFSWETLTSAELPVSQLDKQSLKRLAANLRASERVNPSVKEKSDLEILSHYQMAEGKLLTNLGILLVGTPIQRARLGTSPLVQAVKYDDVGNKINKWVWNDHTLAIPELIDAVWEGIPDFHENYEIPAGLFRDSLPAYHESVVRELLVNALVHRPYTQGGDTFIALYPDRLEIMNPGRLPLGVTPQNILHTTRRRNEALARLMCDLKRMEAEGSGFDLIYDKLLSTGRPAPSVYEGGDSVRVVVQRRVMDLRIVHFMSTMDNKYQLSQRERIVVGLLAQSEGTKSSELAARLDLGGIGDLRDWLERPLRLGIVCQSGKTSGTKYFISPGLLRDAGLDTRTTLSRIQPHRLRALILEDLERYPGSSTTEIRRRIGEEVPGTTLRLVMKRLVADGLVEFTGDYRWRRYRASASIDKRGPHPG